MGESNYNSLTDKLIQNGILNTDNSKELNSNFFEQLYDFEADENPENSPFVVNETNENPLKNKKRINKYDLELINELDKNDLFNKAKFSNFLERLFYKCFPRLYKAKLVKKAMKKMFELNIDEKTLFNKTIPYGENEIRYNDLIKYLCYANELQTKLNKEN